MQQQDKKNNYQKEKYLQLLEVNTDVDFHSVVPSVKEQNKIKKQQLEYKKKLQFSLDENEFAQIQFQFGEYQDFQSQIIPRYMGEQGTMCITDLWNNNLKMDLIKAYQESTKNKRQRPLYQRPVGTNFSNSKSNTSDYQQNKQLQKSKTYQKVLTKKKNIIQELENDQEKKKPQTSNGKKSPSRFSILYNDDNSKKNEIMNYEKEKENEFTYTALNFKKRISVKPQDFLKRLDTSQYQKQSNQNIKLLTYPDVSNTKQLSRNDYLQSRCIQLLQESDDIIIKNQFSTQQDQIQLIIEVITIQMYV